MNDNAFDLHRDAIRQAAVDPVGIAARMEFAKFTAETFKGLGEKLFVCGYLAAASDGRRGEALNEKPGPTLAPTLNQASLRNGEEETRRRANWSG